MDENYLNELIRIGNSIETIEEANMRIAIPQFRNIHSETLTWLANNRDACIMHEIGIEDYITSRNAVLILGLLKTGLYLAAQAVEKLLKCYLLMATNPISAKKYQHRIKELLPAVMKTWDKLDLSPYTNFCKDLEKWYNSRYPDSTNQASHWMIMAIPELDNLVFYLEDNIPIPNNIIHSKYGGGNLGIEWSSIFVRLFGDIYSQQRSALLYENIPLLSRISDLEKSFYLYRMSAVLPCRTVEESKENIQKTETVLNKFMKP